MMAGHSKWANIKRRKEVQDSKRAKVFTKLVREIMVATRQGGEHPGDNPRLRLAIQNAKGANIPKENIERAIEKGSGAGGQAYKNMTYEGYGPQGIAVIIDTMTDNPNRTVADIRAIFNKYQGSLGKQGELRHLFDHLGVFILLKSSISDPEKLSMELIDEGLQNVEEQEEILILYSLYQDFSRLQVALEQRGIEAEEASLQFVPHTMTSIPSHRAEKLERFIQTLEDLDDVQQVYHNMHVNQS